MKIQALMVSDPITIAAHASISEAIELMKVNSIRHLPVVSADNVLEGFLSTLLEKDISDRRPAYRDYVRRTNAFIPGRPKQRAVEPGLQP